MSEESFLDRLKEMKGGSPSQRKKGKRAKAQPSPKESSSSEISEGEKHQDVPQMENLKNKTRSMKVNPLKPAPNNMELEQGEKSKRKSSVKRKLKIKKKKKESEYTKVEKLNPIPKRFNTIAFDNDDNKKFDLVIDETEPDPEFLKEEEHLEIVKHEPPKKLEPVRPNRFDRLLSNEASNTDRDKIGNKQNSKPVHAQQRQRTLDQGSRRQFGDVQPMPLLDKWEKQYGGIKDRQFYVKCDHDYDKWYTNDEGNKFSSFNTKNHANRDNDIQEDIPDDPEEQEFIKKQILKKKGNKLDGSNSHRDFEYDWDEDESMSYLKRFQDENLKENYNKYGQQIQKKVQDAPKVAEYATSKPYDSKSKKVSKRTKMKTDRKPTRHFKSVAPQLDDWDD